MNDLAALSQARWPAPLAPHPTIAGHRVERVLGRGRHSIVYLARRPASCGGGRVALKVARGMRRPDSGAADLREEFAAMAALAHPRVIEAFDHGLAGGVGWLAMEYAQGGDLEAWCRGAGRGTGVFELLHQAASALGWTHANGWVHRDVKPANLFLRQDGAVALGDFGSACRRAAAAPPSAGAMAGTPRYAAPEQTGGAPADPAADVYGLGACLYESLTGRPLFPGETPDELRGQHLMAPIPRLAQELAGWQPLLDAMLAKDPSRRPPDGQAVLSLLERARPFLAWQRGGSPHASRNPS